MSKPIRFLLAPALCIALTTCSWTTYALALVALRDCVEKQFASSPIERHEAHFVDGQEIDAAESPLDPSELALVSRFDEAAHQVRRAHECNVEALLRRLDAECDCEVRFPRPNRPGEDHVLGFPHALASRELRDLRGVETSIALKSKLSSVFCSGNRASRIR
jgi:hypothetical protein